MRHLQHKLYPPKNFAGLRIRGWEGAIHHHEEFGRTDRGLAIMRAEGEGVLFPEWGETFDSGHLFAQITLPFG